MKKPTRSRTAARGVTLVELMVAVTIGMVVLGAVSMVFVNSKASYTTQESSARLQESARFAMHFIARDLRMAGYFGCAGDLEAINSTLNASVPHKFELAIEGVEDNTDLVYPSGIDAPFPTAGAAVVAKHGDCPNTVGGKCADSDAFAVRLADPSTAVSLKKSMPNSSAAAFIDPGHGFQVGDVVMLTDCAGAEVFQITNVSNGDAGNGTEGKQGIVHNQGGSVVPGNSTQKFERTFEEGAQVLKFVNRLYYVGTGKSGEPALWRIGLDGTGAEELVEGIEDMEVTFGKSTTADRTPRQYFPANHAELGDDDIKWGNVVSVRIAMKARPVTNATNEAIDNANNVAPKEFVSTVLLRNLQ